MVYMCIYLRVSKKEIGKIFTGCSELRILDTLSQSIGRGRISQVGPLVIRESRYRSDEVFAPHPKKRSLGLKPALNSWSSKPVTADDITLHFCMGNFLLRLGRGRANFFSGAGGYIFRNGWLVTILGHIHDTSMPHPLKSFPP